MVNEILIKLMSSNQSHTL